MRLVDGATIYGSSLRGNHMLRRQVLGNGLPG
jgi:hypothetical protein